jgi:hypothetical protein
MTRVGWIFFLLIALVCDPCSPQDFAARFAEFELKKAEISEGFSVLVERVTLKDGIKRVSQEDNTAPAKYQNEVTSTRTLQRIVFGDNGRKKRMDGLEFSILDNTDIARIDREAQLIHENVGWYHLNSRRTPNAGVAQFQVKAGVVPMETETRWKHPFYSSLSLSGDLRFDHSSAHAMYPCKTTVEETLPDGIDRLTVYNALGGVCRFKFGRDQEWRIEEVEFLEKVHGMSREEEIAEAKNLAIGKQRKPITITKEMLKDYKTFAITRTEWREVEKDCWVPWSTRIYSEETTENVENEIRYRDWKFMGDVDDTLLDEANFTPEKIAASIDFKAIGDLFDSTK